MKRSPACPRSAATAFLYLLDPAPAVAALRGQAGLRFMHRRGNLEDLFLKLTGREMRE